MKLGTKYFNDHAQLDKNGKPKHREELDSDNWYADYLLINAMMVATGNSDYYADDITVQTAQMILKDVNKSWSTCFKTIKDYAAHPSKYTDRPGLAGYCKKGSLSAVIINNQDAVIYEKKRPKKKKGQKEQKFKPGWELKLPSAGGKRLDLGNHKPKGKLSEVRIVPIHNGFDIQIVTEDDIEPPKLKEMNRVMAADLGVDNLVTLVSNCGLPLIIYKGGILKSVNQWYNKEMARIQSEQTKGGDKKFAMTDEAHRITEYRNNRVRDTLLKVSKDIVGRCVENRIDTLIVGYNKGWKNEIELGHVNNQKFVQIPFSQLIDYLKMYCERAGIRFIKQEESYTSKACFNACDDIPVYGVDEKPEGGFKFSGYRSPTTTYWRRNESGELESYKVKPRGLYRVRNGEFDVNSDANGAANILRKAWPKAFEGAGHCPLNLKDFEVEIIVHPDYERGCESRRKRQMCKNKDRTISNSRRKRLVCKSLKRLAESKSSPSGIEAL